MQLDRLRELVFTRRRPTRRRPTRSLAIEALEDRAVPAVMDFVVQSDYFGTRDGVSQPRSLRGLALSGDDSDLYVGFIQGTSSSTIRRVSSDINSTIIGNDPQYGTNPPYTDGIEAKVTTFLQPKGLATDDRGYVYTTLNSGSNSINQSWRIYSTDLDAEVGTYLSTTAVSAQLSGISVWKDDPDGDGPIDATYYVYLSHNGGSAQIERWNVTDPGNATLDVTWGTAGAINLKSDPTFGTSAFANGLEVAEDGTIYVAGGILGTGRGDSVFKIPSDGNLTLATRVDVNGAMDLALFQGNVYVTQYLAANSTIAVLDQTSLALVDTISANITGTYPTGEDSGFSGIDISATGELFVAEQIYDFVPSAGNYTPPGGTAMTGTRIYFDRVISTQLETTAVIAGTAFLDINANGAKDAGDPVLSGRTVYLDLDDNGEINGNDVVRTTDVDGRYNFGDQNAGNYTVRMLLFSPQTLTGNAAATQSVAVDLVAGADQLNVDLGVRSATTIFPTQLTTDLFTTTYPDSNYAYVYNVFKALLNHDPTASEVAYHVNALNMGYSRTDYAKSIYQRNESLYFQIDQVFQALFGRDSQSADKTFWANELRRGIQPAWMVVTLIGGPEYQNAHVSDAAYITGLYNDILGREPTATDITYWTGFLGGGQSRSTLAFMFAYSEESYRRTVANVFVQFLHRQPTAADYSNWVPLLQNRTITVSRMVELLLASSEFDMKATNATG